MLTDNSNLREILAAEDDRYIEIETDNEFSTPGVYGEASFDITGQPAVDDDLTINWENGDEAITFTFKNSPDNSGKQIATNTGESLDDYVQDTLVPGLLQHPLVYDQFSISLSNLGTGTVMVTFKLRYYSAHNIVITDSSSAILPLANTVNSVKPVRRDNYKISLIAEVDLGSGWEAVELSAAPVNSKVYFSLAQILTRFYSSNARISSLPASASEILSNVPFQMRYHYYEQYGDPVKATTKKFTSNTKLVFPGGSSHRAQYLHSIADAVLDNDELFITNLIGKIELGADQPFVINYLHRDAVSAAFLECEIFYEDGTSATTIVANNTGLSQNDLVAWNASPQFVADNDGSGKKILAYNFYVKKTSPDATLTPVISVEVDHGLSQEETYIEFRNSLGVYEFMRCSGRVDRKVQIEQENEERMSIPGDDENTLQYLDTPRRFTPKLEVASGYRGEAAQKYLIDFLNSREHYLVRGSDRIPVRLRADEYDLYQSQSYLQNGVTFTLLMSTEKNYSHAENSL